MNRYRVDWTTEVRAFNPQEAAAAALNEAQCAIKLTFEVTRIPLDVREVTVYQDGSQSHD